jgi:carbamoyltransferase
VASHRKLGVPRRPSRDAREAQKASYLGPSFSNAEIQAFLDRHDYPYELVEDVKERAQRVAQALANGAVVGFLSGRMEFGPRALGARSILGDPRSPDTQALMNLKIKYRESFRPFAPAVLAERSAEYFDLDVESPYMLLVAPVRAERRCETRMETFKAGDDDLLAVVRQARSDIPAVTHVDYSARVQTVQESDHPAYYAVLEAFERLTGCAVLVNTSFNVRGEPIVCTPQDAYRCFMRTEMDLLVLEGCLLFKEKQPAVERDESWKQEYELD